MGRRGPRPQPTKLKILNGNPGKRPLNKNEPKPVEGEPERPEWLSPVAMVEWDRIVPQLMELGILTQVDGQALAGYCQAVAEIDWATRILDKEGRIISEPIMAKGYKVGERQRSHPAIRLQRDAFARMKQFLAEFGLSPSSRTRLTGNDVQKTTPTPLRTFLANRPG